MMKVRQLKVSDKEQGWRLDKYLVAMNENYSRNYIQYLIKNNYVKVGNKIVKANYRLLTGDLIELMIPPVSKLELIPQDLSLDILYDDSSIVVVNKRPGMVVHPAPGNPTGTLVNGLLYLYEELLEFGDTLRPGIVHRLDRDTSGVMVVAKNMSVYKELVLAFKKRKVEKIYHALVEGCPSHEQGEIISQIGRHPIHRKKMATGTPVGREAVTYYRVLKKNGPVSYLEVNLLTGRTHQIRVHMASLGHPIIGDTVYGNRNSKALAPRQMLHSFSIVFKHPKTAELMTFTAPLPADFNKVLEASSLL